MSLLRLRERISNKKMCRKLQNLSRLLKPSLFSAVFVCLSWSGLLSAEENANRSDSAQNIITRMAEAVRNLNYDGVFIYQRDGQMSTLRLIHRADEDGEKERLLSLTGIPREVIRNAQSVTCIYPDDHAVVVQKSRPRDLLAAQLPKSIDKLLPNYHFSVIGEDRVAGRSSWVISIRPNDAYRYGYQFWVDKESDFLLKSELRNRSGQLLEQIMFTQLNILNDIPDSMLEASITGTGYTWYNNTGENSVAKSEKGAWQAAWMPNGFNQDSHEMSPIADSKKPVDHLIYSDGLATVSIFIEKLDARHKITSGLSRMGSVNAFARVTNGYQITAVGEVPQATVKRMANSVVSSR